MQLGSVRAAGDIEVAHAPDEAQVRAAETLGEGLVRRKLRHARAERVTERVQLDGPVERRRACEQHDAPRGSQQRQHELRALGVLRLQVVRLVGDGHPKVGRRERCSQLLLLLAIRDQPV